MRWLSLLPLMSLGCLPVIGDGGVDCDTMAYASVQATVEDPNGVVLTNATVTFDDGQPCESFEGGGQFVCGWERSGELTLVADALGYEERSVVVDVPQGECHVETQQVTITLEEVICPPVVTYGVEVTVVSASSDRPVRDARVEWLPLDGMDYTNPMPCEDWGETWACAENTGGEIEIWASSREHGSFYDVVDVAMDDCGPITRRITAVVDR